MDSQPGLLAATLLASVIVFIDLLDFALRLHRSRAQDTDSPGARPLPTSTPLPVGRFSPYQQKLHLRPYALAVSVHELGAELDAFVADMEPHRERLFVIDDASGDGTADALEAAGLRVVRGTPNRHKPGAIRELLRHLPPEVETVLILDPDSGVLDLSGADISDLEHVIFEFQNSHHAALCPRLVIERENAFTALQDLEYALSFGVGRKSLGDFSVTSGIALYRRDALERLLDEHSLSVYAEDLENTLHLLARDEQIYYDERLVVRTEGKPRLRDWFSQRVGWSFGLAKVYAQNLGAVVRTARGDPMHFYQYGLYLGVFSLALHPLKLASLVPLIGSALNGLDALTGAGWVPDTALTWVWIAPLIYLKYTVLIAGVIPAATPRAEWAGHWRCAPFYFFYAVAQLVPMTVGFANWIGVRVSGRRLYRDHYSDDARVHG